MTITALVDRLVEFLAAQLIDVRLEPADGSDPRTPDLVAGWLPPIGAEGEPKIPLIIARAVSGQDADDGSAVTVQLYIETYSESEEGWRDVTNLVQRIRGALTSARTIGPFCLSLPLTWQMSGDEPLPQWVAIMTTTWSVPRATWTESTQ